MNYQDAIKIVNKTLRNDKEMFFAFKANIAMSFFDEAKRQGSRDSKNKLMLIGNAAAENFLNLLIREK